MSYIGNTNTTQAFTPAVDFFSGNASTTAFTLSRPVASVAQVQAVISNVPQTPNTAFTVSGNTITFTSAPPSGTNNIYVYYTSPITQVIAPGQNTVYPSSLSTTNALYWDTSGNVGVGTTSPVSKFHVYNSGDVTQTIGSNTGASIINLLSNSNSSGAYNAILSTTASGQNWYIGGLGNSNTLAFATGASTTERMRIDSSGNVGIGTSSPVYPLDVAGAIRGNSWIGRANGSAPTADCAVYRPADSSLGFSTGSAERMRIDSNGNLLVANTGMSNAKFQLYQGAPSTQAQQIFVEYATGTGYFIEFLRRNSGTNNAVGSISASTTTTTYSTSSDYRLKENIAPMTGALAKVSALKPVTYKWKLDDSIGEGFIAHELAEVCPNAVVGEKDAVDADGNPVYQGIDTSFLVATLTAAIQELKALVDTQASTITALTARITALENK